MWSCAVFIHAGFIMAITTAACIEEAQPHMSWSPHGTGMKTPLTHPILAHNLTCCHSSMHQPPIGISQQWCKLSYANAENWYTPRNKTPTSKWSQTTNDSHVPHRYADIQTNRRHRGPHIHMCTHRHTHTDMHTWAQRISHAFIWQNTEHLQRDSS